MLKISGLIGLANVSGHFFMDRGLRDATNRDILLWLLRRRRRFRITGRSMWPLLQPGEEVLLDPTAYRQAVPLQGDIVVAQHPYRPQLYVVKRVAVVFEDGRCFLRGDNGRESTDSSSFGAIAPEAILGKVVSRFP